MLDDRIFFLGGGEDIGVQADRGWGGTERRRKRFSSYPGASTVALGMLKQNLSICSSASIILARAFDKDD